MRLLLRSITRFPVKRCSPFSVFPAFARPKLDNQSSNFASSQSEMSNTVKLWIDCDAGKCLVLTLLTDLHCGCYYGSETSDLEAISICHNLSSRPHRC